MYGSLLRKLEDRADFQKTEEDLEPLEVLDIEEDEPVREDSTRYFSLANNPFENSIFPVLFLNRDLRIIYANQICDELFTGFAALKGNYFIDIFGRSFEMADIRKIRETILRGDNAYSWKGEARTKSRNMASKQVKVYLFPVQLNVQEPSEFVVMFDDVTEENRRLLRNVFMSLLEASKLKDNDTGKHITRVNYYSKRMAQELFHSQNRLYNRIDADFIDNIGFLASMHDVGKIGTPDDILNKEGPLSDWEWTVMREHTKNGAFILSTYPNPMAKEIALSHHERWDGSGYPFQLEGIMIPLAARIVSIADVYDALRMERSYKPALSHDVAVQKITESKGSHFDPFLADVFAAIAGDYNDIYESHKDDKKE
jgi:putative two-component system response regulator